MYNEKNKLIRRSLFSIVSVTLFLIVATLFVFMPKNSEMAGALSFLGRMESISLVEKSDELALDYYYPISDYQGVDSTAYEFEVVNNGKEDSNYQLVFLTGTDSTSVSQNSIRYILTCNGEETDIKTLSDDGVISISDINANEKHSYSLKFWISDDENLEIEGKTFQGILNLNVIK